MTDANEIQHDLYLRDQYLQADKKIMLTRRSTNTKTYENKDNWSYLWFDNEHIKKYRYTPINHQKNSSVAAESDKIQNTRNQGCEYAKTPSRSSVFNGPPISVSSHVVNMFD